MTPGINVAKKAKVAHKIHEYVHDASSESYGLEAAEKLGVSPDRVFKTLVVNLDGKDMAVGVLPVSAMLSMKLIAKAVGAYVLALDIDDAKLERIRSHGADAVFNVRDVSVKEARKEVRRLVTAAGKPDFAWKIFEMSGSGAGQELAYALLPASGTLAVVGFTMAKLELRLSNLMAFDAVCFGNWGCAPELYPAAVEMVLSGKVNLKPFIKRHSLDQIQPLFEAAHRGELNERAILVPAA